MKLRTNSYAIVTAIVVCSLLVAGLTSWRYSGIGAGWQNWYGALCMTAYCVGAVGVIWLGWFWLKLARAITSIASRLKEELTAENEIKIKSSASYVNFAVREPAIIKQLNEAIGEWLAQYTNRITELREQLQDLQIQIQLSQRQKANTEAIIYSLRDAVIVVDEFDRLLMANEAAGNLFHFDFKSSQHKPIDELIAGDKSKFVDFLCQTRYSQVEATRHEIEFSQAETAKIFDCIISCVYDDRQQVCGVVAVLHDITREKQIQQMKNDFVSHVSHELKTPLASITAYSEMLADGDADDEETKKQFYSVIQNQAKRLNRLIEDILNISRIESGLIKIEKKPVSLTILIEEQLQMIKSYAEEKSIEVIAQKPIVYDQVYADKDMISQVIINLLSNAVKYTPCGGSVKIDTAVDETAGTVQVTVTDTGVGIPKDEIEHIFDKFYRVGANKKQAKGTGLGLNLVKQIIEKVHHGRVFVISEPGVGSTFGFELPLAIGQAVEAM
ncbi:MAG: ATP-binding protein [Phycisphaerae bacterium]